MEKEYRTLNSATSKPKHHVISDPRIKHKGLKLLSPKSQVDHNPQHSENVKESAVVELNKKFENYLFERHLKTKMTNQILESLQKKSAKSGIEVSVLEEVFKRGLSSWNPYICKNSTQEQWAFARVNSFISGGKAVELDTDLAEASFKTKETSQKQSTDPSNPMSRLDGTKQAKKTFQKATPGQPISERIIHNKYAGTDSPCWTGYVQKGTKVKNGKVVPNCVPVGESVEDGCPLDEATKKKSSAKPIDPNEEARKLRGLRHKVGHIVHAGLAVKGGAGYRGEVVKIDKDHTYIKIGKNQFGDRIVRAPHHVVSIHEETKEERKERLKKEASRETNSEKKYKETENSIEHRDDKSKRRHERARKYHQEETNSEKRMKVSNIGRPNDPPVQSKQSVLHRTLQIKTKIIDEGN
jgi:hypothetical protein